MDGSAVGAGFASYIDDRPEDRAFLVDRAVYTDKALFDAEIAHIFESGWNYICHESQIAEPTSYFSAHIGRQPVFLTRTKAGEIKGFINACSHRGALLTAKRQGKSAALTCRFHGWSYDGDGTCIRIKAEAEGYGDKGVDRSTFNLVPLGQVASYRGFVFASLEADVPTLDDWLGDTARFIDLMADAGPNGLEVVPGSSTYVVDANWKTQCENAVDGYHVSTVHRVFATTVANRENARAREGINQTESARILSEVPTGVYHLGDGHMVAWATRTKPEIAPLGKSLAELKKKFSDEHIEWMLARGRNLVVFPNLMLMDMSSTQIRVIRPISCDRTEITVYCIAPIGEDAKVRAARLRKFEDFYLTTGMSTSDDVAALESAQEGAAAEHFPWSDFTRGFNRLSGDPDVPAKDIGIRPESTNAHWEDEAHLHGFYRVWLGRVSAGAQD